MKLGDSTTANDGCFKMTSTADAAKSSKSWNDLHTAVKNGWDAMTSSLHTNMVAATDAQALLEQAWLGAYYDSAYWTKVNSELADNGTLAATYTAKLAALNVDNAATQSAYTTVAQALTAKTVASTLLSTANGVLTGFLSAQATAQATSDALTTRITRADAEITELESLSKDGTPGKLDTANTIRLDDYNAYASDGSGSIAKGAKVTADEAKVAADNAIKARTSSSATDGGSLVEPRELAQAAWNLAKTATTNAQNALTAGLDSAVLETLRATVVTDTAEWDK